jgi:hypothetical protein
MQQPLYAWPPPLPAAASLAYALPSYALDGGGAPQRLQRAVAGLASDLPLRASHDRVPRELLVVRLSAAAAPRAPAAAADAAPSARLVRDFQASLQAESPALLAHLQAPLGGLALLAPPRRAAAAERAARLRAERQREPNSLRDFAAPEEPARAGAEVARSEAAAAAAAPELIADLMLLPASALEAEAAAALAVDGAGAAALRGAEDALLFAARAGGRAYGERDVASFRAHYAAVAAAAAAGLEDGAGAGAGVGVGAIASASSRRAGARRARYSAESRALLASLGAMRAGLQQLEQRRRRFNAVLGREPSTGEQHALAPEESPYAW